MAGARQLPSDYKWLTERPIAHRGYHDMNHTRMENSPSAFAAAIDSGFAIECDVHPLADGGVVTFHDYDLRRLAGREGNVRALSIGDLPELRLGGTDDAPQALAETLAQVGGRVPIVIELKGFHEGQDDFAGRVTDLLEGYAGEAAVMSFDHDLVRGLRATGTARPVGLTAEGRSRTAREAHATIGDAVDFVSYGVGDLPNPFVASFRETGRPVITWTVRTPDDVARTREHADQMTFEGFDPRSPDAVE